MSHTPEPFQELMMVTVLGVWEYVVTGKMGLTLGSVGTWWGTGHVTRKRHKLPGAQSDHECQMKPFILEGSGYVIYALSTVVG